MFYNSLQLLGWGRNIFMGYLNRESETRDVFVPATETDKETTEGATANDNQNWLKLGDLGYIDEDGFLNVLGKSEDFITLSTKEMICPAKVSILIRIVKAIYYLLKFFQEFITICFFTDINNFSD